MAVNFHSFVAPGLTRAPAFVLAQQIKAGSRAKPGMTKVAK
jgi:hypothetical protein